MPVDFALAFLMGLGGSVHCLGMCSGFALAVARGGGKCHLVYQGLYNAGRLSSYMLLGLAAGILGQSVSILVPLRAAQVGLSIAAGAVMAVVGVQMVGLWSGVSTKGPLVSVSRKALAIAGFVADTIRTLMPPTGPAEAYYLGLLNGMLPCPVIYALLPAALATRSGAQGGLLMLALGAGTLPMMLGVGVVGRALIPRVQGFARIPGVVVLIFGFVTLSRVFINLGPSVHMGH